MANVYFHADVFESSGSLFRMHLCTVDTVFLPYLMLAVVEVICLLALIYGSVFCKYSDV